MNLKELVPTGRVVLAMTPEGLAMPILRSLNATDDLHRRRGSVESILPSRYCAQQAQLYTDISNQDCMIAIAAGMQHLCNITMLVPSPFVTSGGYFVLSVRAKQFKDEADYKRYSEASRYPRGSIHPLIEARTFSEFMSGDYETAVFKAMKTLEEVVRKRAGLGDEAIGVPMVRTAFHPKTGPLTDKSEHEGEREALMHLMAGAIGRFKNPTSHRFTGLDDPTATIEILQLASSLVRIAEQRPAMETGD